MRDFFTRVFRGKGRNRPIIVVSGLPRSGTSMMMEMLEAGGVPVLTDGIRKADKDNPRGYREFEKVKKVDKDTSWLDDCRGKACKIISALLRHLPRDKSYKIIFMNRNMEEVLASQRAMLEKRGVKEDPAADEGMAERFERHLLKVKDWLAREKGMDVLDVNYNEVIRNPAQEARIVAEFLDGAADPEKMSAVVERSLYRQRK